MGNAPIDIEIAIIGAGPAGLMAAETLVAAGHKPMLFDAMATPARKFLMAGKSGLNLTHSEPFEKFSERYGERCTEIAPALRDFTPENVRNWADNLGVTTFVGSSGRVFPKSFKASPLLRAWLERINTGGGQLRTRHKWAGWTEDGCHMFVTPFGRVLVRARATIFALGGVSWPRLGSDGTWQPHFAARGIEITEFKPSNCGFNVVWSPYFRDRFGGEPIKNTVLSVAGQQVKGDFVITQNGVEGSAIYTLSAPLRDMIDRNGSAQLVLDLTPDKTEAQLIQALAKPRGKKSFATYIKRTAKLSGAKANLLRECADPECLKAPASLAKSIKALPLNLTSTRPIAEAISTAGGVSFSNLDAGLMVKSLPGTFVAGEMLDWEAPTGGYLLTACFAQGKQAAKGVIGFLSRKP
jgi:uncharacterized flavoprotein (TIGR03862 family)